MNQEEREMQERQEQEEREMQERQDQEEWNWQMELEEEKRAAEMQEAMVQEAMEIDREKAIVEKAFELMLEYAQLHIICCNGCHFTKDDPCKGFTGERRCHDVMLDYFMEKVRENDDNCTNC